MEDPTFRVVLETNREPGSRCGLSDEFRVEDEKERAGSRETGGT